MNPTPFRIVVAGCGGIAQAWLEPLAKRSDVVIAGLIDLDPKRAAERAAIRVQYTPEGVRVAITDDGKPVNTALLMRRALEYAKGFDYLILAHSDDHALCENGAAHEGEVALRLGIPGIPGCIGSPCGARYGGVGIPRP